jgi:hypothetical protein
MVIETDLPLLPLDADPGGSGFGSGFEKSPKWIPLRISFRKILYILAGIIALSLLVISVISSIWGIQAYHRLFFPHRAVHASTSTSKDPSRVVRPYFTPNRQAGGGRDDNENAVKLITMIWFREGIVIPSRAPEGAEDDEDWRYRDDERFQWDNDDEGKYRAPGEQGFLIPEIIPKEGVQNTWEGIWTHEMGMMDMEESRSILGRVELPGRVV